MIQRTTQLSACLNFRWTLWRDWSKELQDRGAMTLHFTEDPHGDYYPGKPDTYVNFIMLNPSTADATDDDNTTRKCVGFAQRWGFGAVCLTNLFGFRSRAPRKLYQAPDPVGELNDHWIKNVASEAGLVVCAWGNHGRLRNRGEAVLKTLRELGVKANRLGKLTNEKQPGHPLFIPYTAELVPFEIG